MSALVVLLGMTLAFQDADPGSPVRMQSPDPRLDFGDNYGVRFVAFSPDGKTLVSASNKSVSRWNSATGERISRFQPFEIMSMDVSPDGTLAAVGDGGDQAFALFNLETGKQLERVVQQDQARWLKFSPDGRTLAEGG